VIDTKTRLVKFSSLIVAGLLLATGILQVANAQAPSPRDALLVTTQWLKQHASDKNLVLLHVGEEKDYAAGHIAGARLLDVDAVAPHGAPDDLMLELPASAVLHKNLEALGISDTSRIVVYFATRDVPTTTRVVFTLDAAGLGDRVSLLDGGMQAWQRSGNTLTTDVPVFATGKLAPLIMQERVVDAAFVQGHLKAPGYQIVDARAPVFYDGARPGMGQPANLKGHLPGATNIPFTSVTGTDLTLKPADELAALFKAAGVGPGDKVIAYCHIGQQATAIVFAARTLGIDVVLYDGSFQDWSRRGLPVEMSAAPSP
jgi:thiosulfate/3-mercaptopyruvate sulfurtransferase